MVGRKIMCRDEFLMEEGNKEQRQLGGVSLITNNNFNNKNKMKEKNKMVYNFCYEAAKSTMISLQCNVLMHISAPVISVQLPSIGRRQRRCWSAGGDILIKLLSFEIYD